MKLKQSIAFAAIASSIITNSLCAYSEDNIIISEQTSIETESNVSVDTIVNADDPEEAEISVSENNEISDETESAEISVSENNEISDETISAEENISAPDSPEEGESSVSQEAELAVLSFDGGNGSPESPYQISTPEQLNEIRNNLSANYVLTADIDLSGIENFEPVGTFVPMGQSGEEAEMPTTALAFTGIFDGSGHTISNLKINIQSGFAVGLFGCVSGGTVKDLKMTNADVSASMMTGCCVGYLFDGTVENITLANSTVNGTESTMGTDMIGGIAGAGMESRMNNCTAENITINLVSGSGNSGLAAGGFEVCTLSGVNASGVINAGDNCKGLGGIAGCNFSGDKIENCDSSVTINAGSDTFLVGGTVGYAGGFESETNVNNCNSEVNISLGSNSSRIGGIIGGGFFNESYKNYYPNPSKFKVNGCTSSGNIICPDGKNIGSIAGYTLLSQVDENNTSSLKINGNDGNIIGDTENYTVLNSLQGTYQQFFTDGVFESKYDKIWHDYCAAVVGESNAESTVSMLKYSIGGKLYGEEAVRKFSASPETTQFFCDFTNGLKTLTINGSNISGTDENGNTLFSHTYYYVDTLDSLDYPGFTFDVFATNEDAGEFRYFAFAPDTPDSTYHIEFRYCGEYEDLLRLLSGKYAYWLAAGIRDVDIASDIVSEKVIALFCTENMKYSNERSADSLKQLNDIKGKWNCDMTAFKAIPEYANADMYIEINAADGIGRTYVDMTGSGKYSLASEFFAYTYNTSENGKEGIYVVYTDDEGVKYSKYKISDNNGVENLDFYSIDGDKLISYYREIQKEESTESTTKDNSSKNNTQKDDTDKSSSSGGGKSSSKASSNAGTEKDNTVITSDNTEKNNYSDNNPKNEDKSIVLKIASPLAQVFGKSTSVSQPPVIVNGRTMLPIRFIAENTGYNTEWSQNDKKAVISLDDNVVEIHENSDIAYINGEEVKIDSAAFNNNGTLFVPARFIFEAFGADVLWNAADKSISINFK